jgi:Kef-type K+ transport system membrane component KefB
VSLNLLASHWLIRFGVPLALMHWAHMPFWGAVLLFVAMSVNMGVNVIGAFILGMAEAMEDDQKRRDQ